MDVNVAKQRLAEAEEALHQLSLGKRVVSLTDQNGESIQFRAGSANELENYIASLDRKIRMSQAGGNGPLKVFF